MCVCRGGIIPSAGLLTENVVQVCQRVKKLTKDLCLLPETWQKNLSCVQDICGSTLSHKLIFVAFVFA